MSNLASVLGRNFDATTVNPESSFAPLPKGKYLVIVTSSEVKDVKDQHKNPGGKYLQLTHEVVDGQYKGRKLWNRLNIVNRNKDAEDIAHRALSALCHAAGVLNLQDSSQLHNIPVIADVKVSKEGDQNDIVTYAAANGASAPAAGGYQPGKQQAAQAATTTAGTTTTSPSSAATTGTPPWKR